MIGRPVGIHIPKAVILAKSKNPGHSVVWSLATPSLFLGDPPIRGSGSVLTQLDDSDRVTI